MEQTQEKDGVVRHTVQGVVRRLELLEARVRHYARDRWKELATLTRDWTAVEEAQR